jgi:hypothetical protein
MSGRRSVPEMVGEVLREIGVLVVVFVALDSIFQPEPFPVWFVSGIGLVVGSTSLTLGIWFERSRKS